jgi:hypothetical protein
MRPTRGFFPLLNRGGVGNRLLFRLSGSKHLFEYNPYQTPESGRGRGRGPRRIEHDPYAAAWEGGQRQASPIDRADILDHMERVRRRALGLG